MINRMNEVEGGIEKMALGHNYFGAHCLQGAQLRSDYLKILQTLNCSYKYNPMLF